MTSLVLVFRVTRTRIILAKAGSDTAFVDQPGANPDLNRYSSDSKNCDPARRPSIDSQETAGQLKQTRWDHYNVSMQFAASSIVLLLSEVGMLFNCILGYKVHERVDLLAVSILLPMGSYITWSSFALGLITVNQVYDLKGPR